MQGILLADSGSTSTQWSFLNNDKIKRFQTEGMSPYFLTRQQMESLLSKKVIPKLKSNIPKEIMFFGTGCGSVANRQLIQDAFKTVFVASAVKVQTDLAAAAVSLCGNEKGIACILGTGTNSCYYNGRSIKSNSPGLGYILGDEGSGTYLGKKVIQHYMYDTFDDELKASFDQTYNTTGTEILHNVYREPLPNRYLAGFSKFLHQHRGHYMVENILEDSFSDFVYNHLYKYRESWKYPIHFTGSIAWHFRDVLKKVLTDHQLQCGIIAQSPMKGLEAYYK